jgi:spermidine/putrescine ABC transporter ATP-binding subunit
MSSVRLESVIKSYGSTVVVDGVSLSIDKGEFVTLLGASGSGKTTCLRMIAGFVTPNSGRVLIDDKDVTNVPPHRRDTGMVFQQYALFPHMTVEDNVAFGLKIRGLGKDNIRKKTKDVLQLVHLDKLAGRYPSQLSGGQKQRVALARAVVIGPRVLLLDEPLAALDLKLREELQNEIKRVQEALGITAVFVTHDQNEAFGLSDRVVIMREGRILQISVPTELYRRPNSRYVASFVGSMNFIEAEVTEVHPEDKSVQLKMSGSESAPIQVTDYRGKMVKVGERCVVAFRPEHGTIGAAATNCIKAALEKKIFTGSEWKLTCSGASGSKILVTVPQSTDTPELGSAFSISWLPDQCILLPRETENT